jgi:hypothetical protein
VNDQPLTDEERYQAVRRRGWRQLDAIRALMNQLTEGEADLDKGAEAARQVATFALTEGWATGPLWVAYGPQFLLTRWAVQHHVDTQELDSYLASKHRTDSAGEAVVES